MPWSPDDWEVWLHTLPPTSAGEPQHVATIREILRRLPDRRKRHVAVLGHDDGGEPSFADGSLADVFMVDLVSEGAVDTIARPVDGVFDVAVAIDSIVGPARDVDLVFERVRRSLVEGGIFLATFPAALRSGRPFELPLGGCRANRGCRRLHEVELQYRLHRAGFQGLRLRRLRDETLDEDRIVCMAVRRALN